MSDPHRGGKLEDMAVHGTKIPSDAGTQNVVPSQPDKRASKAYSANTIRTELGDHVIPDNTTAMPSGHDESGYTGDVTSATGHELPVDVEAKRVGMDTHGGKEQGHTGKEFRANTGKAAGTSDRSKAPDQNM
ncbi:hypothetical protein L873DRAFT_1799615 [Choiromyces venosus 120613-1]|uniref:Uncharacterized protein n=1 Tax=Choiromyces venosus 120613-1 TaxID=1336337 RepID=A0A3N4K495_9PEZI|nr:hypothetical protein L873DRAFT_1799615 [Choiromyces venosus 120613-1]